MTDVQLYVGNTNLVELVGLRDPTADTDVYLNDLAVGKVQVWLFKKELENGLDVEVSGASWPLNLSYVADSKGIYRASLPSGVAIVAGDLYRVRVTVDGGTNLIGKWEPVVLAVTRRSA